MAVKFFDEQWYLARNPDVAEAVKSGSITAEQHFEQFGVDEGRSPSPLFDTWYYLEQNPDVKAAVEAGETTAYAHFEAYGHTEGRKASPYFNPDFYLAENSDVADAVEAGDASVYEHYQAFGLHEGRAPLALFDAEDYFTANPDVAEALDGDQTAAARHFLTYGVSESRPLNPVLSVGAYLAANADVQAAVDEGQTTGLAHMLNFALEEGRDLGYGVSSAQFEEDPVYQAAVEAGEMDVALARVSEVSPFLPEFQAPEGFVLPADWPIPQGFVPVEGTTVQIPEGWQPAEPTRLPDYFEQPFTAELTGVTVTFPGATGEIQLIKENGFGTFAQGNFVGEAVIPLNGVATVDLEAEQTLVGLHSDIAGLSSVTGEGSVTALGTAEADEIDASEWDVVNLTIDAREGDDTVTIADTQTAIGGEGADTFVISATAGAASVITVDDYSYEEGDVIDLTAVENFNLFTMEVRGAEHNGTTWEWGPDYDGDSVGIWFTGELANVQITGARNETMKFALPDIEGFEGYNTLQLNISQGGVLQAGDEAPEILRGGDGTQFLISGAQADILSGGAGIDVFVIDDAEASSLDSMDRILDFDVSSDVLVTRAELVPGRLSDGGTVANLEAGTIAAALTAETFAAKTGAYFTVGEGGEARSFVALNDGTAGFDAATDTLVEVTGLTGELANITVIGVPTIPTSTAATPVEEVLAA